MPWGELAKSLLSQHPAPGSAGTSSRSRGCERQPGKSQDAGDGVWWKAEKSFGGAEAGAEVHSSPGCLFKYLIPHGGEAVAEERDTARLPGSERACLLRALL